MNITGHRHTWPSAARRRLNRSQTVEPGPLLNRVARLVAEHPAEYPRHSETAVIRRAAADPREATRRPRLAGSKQQPTHSPCVQVERMKLAFRQQSQAVRLRRLHHRLAGPGIEPPGCRPCFARRIDTLDNLLLQAKCFRHHRPKTVPSVTHWQQHQRVARARRRPSTGNRPGCFQRRERPLEFVRNNENSAWHGAEKGCP